MEGEMIVGLAAVIGLIVIPSLAIAVRLSLKPMVEAIAHLHDTLGKAKAVAPAADNDEIRARLSQLEATVEELRESSAFYGELRRPTQEFPALTGEAPAIERRPLP